MAISEGYHKKGRVITQGDIYFGKLAEFAMHNCTFYECFKCSEFFFGGMQDCMQAMQAEDTLKKEDLLCKDCTTKELGFGESMCSKHGNEFVDWKCNSCCSVALFFCKGGKGNYCTPCHNDAMARRLNPTSKCLGGKTCPLRVPSHPIASKDAKKSMYPLGCSLCRSEKLSAIATNENASVGINVEKRADMIKKYSKRKGFDIKSQMRVTRGPASEVKET